MSAPYTRYLPLAGILSAVGLFMVAAANYPGGTLDAADLIGYDWTRHYISTLFAATAVNGDNNPSRYFAIPAMLILCTSIAVVFRRISTHAASKTLRRMIEIGGIGSMVYAFLAVTTPMHDLLVSIASLFFVVAVLATLRMLYDAGRTMLVLSGTICFAILTVCAVMYYGNVLLDALAVTQKLTFVLFTGWLLALHSAVFDPTAAADARFRRRELR